MDEIRDCISCRFWANINLSSQGYCKRRAPVLVAVTYVDGLDRVQSEAQTLWPVTGDADCCGEFEHPAAPVEPEPTPPQADLTPAPSPEAIWRRGQWVGPGTDLDVPCPGCEGAGEAPEGTTCPSCNGFGYWPF